MCQLLEGQLLLICDNIYGVYPFIVPNKKEPVEMEDKGKVEAILRVVCGVQKALTRPTVVEGFTILLNPKRYAI